MHPNIPMEKDRAGQSRNKADLIIYGGTLISMSDEDERLQNSTVYIRDGTIIAIERLGLNETALGPDAELIDARDTIVMPGLINAHTHAAMTLFRGLADDLPLKQWLFEKIFPAEAKHLSQEAVYWGSLLACLEMIASGTTCFADGYFYEDGTAQAVREAGLRALLAQGVIDFPAPGVEDPSRNLEVARAFMERWKDASTLIIPGMFCHSPLTCSERTLQGAWKISLGMQAPLQVHVSETAEQADEIVKRTGKRPVEYLDGLGLAEEGLIAVHAVHLDTEEIEILSGKGIKVVHVPESNMKLGSGVARVPEMLKSGIMPGLGTDGCASNNNLDLFQEMDTAAKLGKVYTMDPVSLKAGEVLRMATKWGAAVLGLEKEIGTIEVGKKADIIVIDLSHPHLWPIYDHYSALVYSANGADVRDVIVDGEVLMRNREFKTLDAAEIMRQVKKIGRRIGANE